MKKPTFIFLIFSGLLFSSCSKEGDSSRHKSFDLSGYPASIIQTGLIGKWQVVRATGGIGGSNWRIENQQWFWTFNPSEKIIYTKAGVSSPEGFYKVEKYDSQQQHHYLSPPESKYILVTHDAAHDHSAYWGIQLVKSDSLVIEPPCCDMFTYYLIRK